MVGSASLYSNRYQSSGTFPFTAVGTTTANVNDGYLARTWAVTSTTRYPADCAACPNDPTTPSLKAKVDPGLTMTETLQLVAPGQVLTPRLNQLDIGFKKIVRIKDRYVFEPEVQIFNMLNSNAAVTQSTTVSTTIAPFLPPSACGASTTLVHCGVGGPVTTLTNPRILRLTLLFRF